MVKLRVALDNLTKAQLLDIVKSCPHLSIASSKNRTEIIDYLDTTLPSTSRLSKLLCLFNEKDNAVIRMFLAEKKLRYEGMSQIEFAKFLQLNMRMSNSFADTINKMRAIGLIFMNVDVKGKQKVVFPSEYLKYFDDYYKGK